MKNLRFKFQIVLSALVLALCALPVHAAITEVSAVGVTNSSKTSGTTISKTPGATVPANALVVVVWAGDPASGTVSCSDDAGNTYTVNLDISNGSGTSGVRTVICSAPVTSSISTSQSIIVTHPTLTARIMVLDAFNGLDQSGSRVDVSNSATGTSTTPSVTKSTIASSTLLIGGLGAETVSSSLSQDLTYTLVASSFAGTSGGGDTSNISGLMEFKVLSSAGSQTFAPSISASKAWGALIIAYKDAAGGGAPARVPKLTTMKIGQQE